MIIKFNRALDTKDFSDQILYKDEDLEWSMAYTESEFAENHGKT